MKKANNLLVFPLLLLTILSVVQVLAFHSSIKANPIEGYDDGGNFRLGFLQGGFARDEMEAKVRGFIWSHWTHKRKGRVSATYLGIDSSFKSTFLVKKDTKGEWVVIEKFIENGPFIWSKGKVTVNLYRRVDRVEVTAVSEIPKAIPAESSREPLSYRLRLRAGSEGEDFFL